MKRKEESDSWESRKILKPCDNDDTSKTPEKVVSSTGMRDGLVTPHFLTGTLNSKYQRQWFSSIDNKKCVPWAEKALERYNAKEGARFKVGEIGAVMFLYLVEKELVHMNFEAKSADSASPELFFAEMYIVWNKKGATATVTEVTGCCLLKKSDAEDPSFKLCGFCGKSAHHPGPAYGYHSASGDDFAHLLVMEKREFI